MKNMMKVITTISVLSLVLITFGVTLAFYSYVKRGTTENTIQSGAITFIYTEIDGQGAGIGITDALPMSDALGVAQTGERNVFNYKIKSENPTDKYINYTVTVRKKSTGTELDNYVKLNVKEVGGSYNKTKFYKDLPLYNNLNNERIIYQGEVTNDPNYEKDFELRMWLSDTLTLDENTNDKSFSITVNVYAQGADVSASANCGEAVCEDKTFAQYMETQDQAIVGQYVTIKPPTGGSNPNSFNGLGLYDDWLKAFVRPIEYAKIYDAKTGQSPAYPDPANLSNWERYAYGTWPPTTETYMPEYLDNQVVANTGKHVNMWLAGVNIASSSSRGFALYGMYVPENQSFYVSGNYPTQGFAAIKIGQASPSLYYPKNGNSTLYWIKKDYPWSSDLSGNSIINSLLVYNVDAFKTYLENMDAQSMKNFISVNGMNTTMFILAECNIPEDD